MLGDELAATNCGRVTHNKVMRLLASLIVLTCAVTAAAQNQSTPQVHPDLNGTWKLNAPKSDLNDDYRYAFSLGEQTVTISQHDAEIKVARHFSFGETNFVVYTDGRAASNRDTTGETFKATAKWEGRKLVSRYALQRVFSGNPETADVIDEWTISSDGKTLTLKTTMRYLQRGADAAHREPFRGYVPRLWLRRVYERI